MLPADQLYQHALVMSKLSKQFPDFPACDETSLIPLRRPVFSKFCREGRLLFCYAGMLALIC